MRKYIKAVLIIFLIIFHFGVITVDVFAVDPPAKSAVANALDNLEDSATVSGVFQSTTSPAVIIGNAINLLLTVMGLILLIIIVYGGITWMTAGGDEGNVKKARTMMIQGVIGMAVTLSAYALTQFVVDNIVEATGNAL